MVTAKRSDANGAEVGEVMEVILDYWRGATNADLFAYKTLCRGRLSLVNFVANQIVQWSSGKDTVKVVDVGCGVGLLGKQIVQSQNQMGTLKILDHDSVSVIDPDIYNWHENRPPNDQIRSLLENACLKRMEMMPKFTEPSVPSLPIYLMGVDACFSHTQLASNWMNLVVCDEIFTWLKEQQNESFDAIVHINVMEDYEQAEKHTFLTHARRILVLKPSSRLFFACYAPDDEPLGSCLSECSPEFVDKCKCVHLLAEKEWRFLFAQTGFTVLHTSSLYDVGDYPTERRFYRRHYWVFQCGLN